MQYVMMLEDADRYRLAAFVCGQDCVRWSSNEGWQTFTQIYLSRPMGCRYAVVETVWGATWAWDMYATFAAPKGGIEPPTPLEHVTVDAAIMACALDYDREGENRADL